MAIQRCVIEAASCSSVQLWSRNAESPRISISRVSQFPPTSCPKVNVPHSARRSHPSRSPELGHGNCWLLDGLGSWRAKGRFGGDSSRVYEQVKEIVVRQLGVRPEEVVPTARFVQDLRAESEQV